MIAIDNCTIVYREETQDISGVDPITNEPIFTVSTTEETMRVSIERETVEATFGVLAGRDQTEHYYYGRTRLPASQLPSWYQPGCNLELRFDNGLVCKGYVYYSHPGRLGLDEFFGAAIEIIVNY